MLPSHYDVIRVGEYHCLSSQCVKAVYVFVGLMYSIDPVAYSAAQWDSISRAGSCRACCLPLDERAISPIASVNAHCACIPYLVRADQASANS